MTSWLAQWLSAFLKRKLSGRFSYYLVAIFLFGNFFELDYNYIVII